MLQIFYKGIVKKNFFTKNFIKNSGNLKNINVSSSIIQKKRIYFNFCEKSKKREKPEEEKPLTNKHEEKSESNRLNSEKTKNEENLENSNNSNDENREEFQEELLNLKKQNLFLLLKKFNFAKLMEIYNKIDSQVLDNEYKVDKVPDPNSFGEAVIYYMPHTSLPIFLRGNHEYTSLPFLVFISFLSHAGIGFNILAGINIYWDWLIFLTMLRSLQPFTSMSLYQVNLLNEKQVKFIYINGKTEIVDIKDIELGEKNQLRFQNENPNATAFDIILNVKKDGKNKEVYLRFKALNEICFADLDILIPIINKNINKLSTE
jgi:hypothetical protein